MPTWSKNLAAVLEKEVQDIADANPWIAKFVDLTTTYNTPAASEGRQMSELKIYDNVNVDEDETAMLIVGTHPAREIDISPSSASMPQSGIKPNTGPSAPRCAEAVDGRQIWIALISNANTFNYVLHRQQHVG